MQCISLTPDPTFKRVPLLRRGKAWPGYDHNIMAPAITSLAAKKGCGFLAVRYLEVKIMLRGSIGSEQSVRYSELRGCPLLGGS